MSYRKLANPTKSDLDSLPKRVSRLAISGDLSIDGIQRIAELSLRRLHIVESSLNDEVLRIAASIPTLRLLNLFFSIGFGRDSIDAIAKSGIETLGLFSCFELTDADLVPLGDSTALLQLDLCDVERIGGEALASLGDRVPWKSFACRRFMNLTSAIYLRS
jgi:hypothetical protein